MRELYNTSPNKINCIVTSPALLKSVSAMLISLACQKGTNQINKIQGPVRGFRDTGYLDNKLTGYRIFEEKTIGIWDIRSDKMGCRVEKSLIFTIEVNGIKDILDHKFMGYGILSSRRVNDALKSRFFQSLVYSTNEAF